MKVEQIYSIVNDIAKEIIGDTAVVNEDLSNLVDVGKQMFEATDVENYVKKLIDHIGKVQMASDRKLSVNIPSIVRDGWEFGSVLERVYCEMPEAKKNDSWDLQDGQSYDPNIFYKPKVSYKLFNSKETFEIDMSFTEKQVKSAFDNAQQMNSFISMLYTAVENAMTLRLEEYCERCLNHAIATTIDAEYWDDSQSQLADLTTKSTIKAVNLLKLYNDTFNTQLTADKCMTTPEFIRFACLQMKLYMDRLATPSKLFNIEGHVRFTGKQDLNVVMLSEFKSAADVYLQSDTYNKEYTALPSSSSLAYWQGSGEDWSFDSTSKIHVTIENGHEIAVDGILAVMFDRDALMVANVDRRTTSNYNPRAEFYTNFYKADVELLNDFSNNIVTFFVA